MTKHRWRARWWIPLILLAAVVVVGYAGWGLWSVLDSDPGVEIAVDVPQLSDSAEAGRVVYDRHCAQCHGLHGGGSADGPPLVHPIYRPAQHADVAFTLAVRRGVRAHHWRFGDMPPQADPGSEEMEAITRYIRELQRGNGIE